MTENQKLREHLREIIAYARESGHEWLCLVEAEQALALPTADHIPESGEMVVDHLPDTGKMIETAAPVGERELPEPFGYVSDGDPEGLRFQHKPWPDVHALINSVMPVYSQAQMQAALRAGDAADAQRTPQPHAVITGKLGTLCSFNSSELRKGDPIYTAAQIDAAMRKGQL